MSGLETIREDARRDALYDRMVEAMPDACSECGARDWKCIGSDPNYGADADGRRGVMEREWECRNCGNVETTG